MNAAERIPSTGSSTEPELVGIATLCVGAVRYMTEQGLRYIYMEGLRFLARGEQMQMDALLCLNYHNTSYPTKLYLPTNLGLGLNWNESAYILARPWHSWSWSGVPANQPLLAILANHLGAFQ